MELRSFSSRPALASWLAERIGLLLHKAIAAEGKAGMAVSGGATPTELFERLSELDVPWQQATITLADERWVEPSSEASNECLVRRHLLRNKAALATFVGLKNEASTAEDGERECRRRLEDVPWPLAVLVLGMGNDGHVASLFPCSEHLAGAIDMSSGKSCMAIRPQTAPHQRMTLTLPAILSARAIFLLLAGPDKKATLEKALELGPPEKMPIRFVLRQQNVPVVACWAP